jgi:hypothetical protein
MYKPTCEGGGSIVGEADSNLDPKENTFYPRRTQSIKHLTKALEVST